MQLAVWFFFSIITGFALVHIGRLPLWLNATIATILAYGLQRICLRWFLRSRHTTLSAAAKTAAQTGSEPENNIENLAVDLANPPRCLHCGGSNVAKIIYGKPALTRQILEGLEAGTIIAGGCLVHNGAPDWHCYNCKSDFGPLSRDPDTQARGNPPC